LYASIAGEIELPEQLPYDFDGRFKADVRLQYYGMFKSCISIANVCSQIGQQLISAIDGVALHSYTGVPFFQKNLQKYSYLNKNAPIGFFYGIPDAVPEFFFGHETTIGGFVCETNTIPARWARILNKFDLIIVPSQFCRSAFLNSGVDTPMLVVHHGLEPEYQSHQAKQLSGRFIFYNTFNSHSFPGRKSCEELIRCFKRAFDGRSDVQLRLRAQPSPTVQDCLARYEADSLVFIDPSGNASTGDFAAIYSEVHCTVHPSKGEGFGLIPFQSIACETPVIAPYSTGMTEYLTENNAMLLRTKGRTAGKDVYYKSGTYDLIDEDHLVELLRYATDHWETEYQKVKQVAPGFRKKYQWESVLADMVSLIQELLELKDSRDRREKIRTRVTENGVA